MSDESMSKSNTVKMIADLGVGDAVNAGHCHASQARILVKKNLAEWKDGKLLVRLRPVHLAVAVNTPILEGEDKDEVSKAEVERRTEWLRAIILAVANSDTHGSDLGVILGLHNREPRVPGPRENLEHILEIAVANDKSYKREAENILRGQTKREKGDAEWFKDGDDPLPGDVTDEDLMMLWPSARDVSAAFDGGSLIKENSQKALQPQGPVYTPEDVRDGGIMMLTVPFPKCGSGIKPRVPTQVVACPTCGQGKDTDGDGNCPLCKSYLKIPTVR